MASDNGTKYTTAEATKAIASTLEFIGVSPNEPDRNFEAANLVDGLFAISRAIQHLARAVEGHKCDDLKEANLCFELRQVEPIDVSITPVQHDGHPFRVWSETFTHEG